MKRRISGLVLTALLLLCLGSSRADPSLTLQDSTVRQGSWQDAYTAILAERAADIQAYQEYISDVTDIPACRPVGLQDLTGDGIPELFLIDLVDDTEYGFKVGRFWIYTPDSGGVRCVLTLQPEIDDLLYSTYYLAKDGLLTIHFSDCEMGWIMRFRPDPEGTYAAETTLTEQEDFSGEGPDMYYRNGGRISLKEYQSLTAQIRADQGALIGSLMVDDGGSGFTYTLEEAREALSSGTFIQAQADD